MPEEWPDILLGDVATEITVGHVGPMATRYVPTGTPFLRSQNVKRLRLDLTDVKFIPPDFHAQLAKSRLRPGDVVIVRTGEPGACAVIPDELHDANCSDLVIVRPGEHLDARYLAYYVNVAASHHVASHLVGAVQQHFNVGAARTLPMKLPPLAEQKEIAAVLGSLDDKIEQNRRTGRKLEALARAVFKAWFVDFEPVKAKAAGATAFPGMTAETFATLPTRFVDSEFGPVPEGWEEGWYRVAELERAGTLIIGDGYRAKRSELAETGVPFIRAGNVNGTIITEGAELFGKPAIAKAGVKRSKVWDTVFTSKGTVGRIGLVTPATGDVVYAPQVCFWRALDRDALSPFLLHLWVKSESFTCQWMSVKGQTDMADFVSLSDQRAMTMFVPAPEVQRGFDNIVRPIVELMAVTAAESAKLAALRDHLLPRLLSGRVRVSSGERVAEKRA